MKGGQCRQNENEQCQEEKVEEDKAAWFTTHEGILQELAWCGLG